MKVYPVGLLASQDVGVLFYGHHLKCGPVITSRINRMAKQTEHKRTVVNWQEMA